MAFFAIRRSWIIAVVVAAQLGAIVWLAIALRNSRASLKRTVELNELLTSHPEKALAILSLKDVKEWRNQYGFLLDSYKDRAIDRFGFTDEFVAFDQLEKQSGGSSYMTWKPSPRTDDRTVTIELYRDRIVAVTVDPRPSEVLDLVAAMQEAKTFTFKTDTIYSDTAFGKRLPTQQFILAKTDGSMILTFTIGESGFDFESVEFR